MKGQEIMLINVRREASDVRIVPVIVSQSSVKDQVAAEGHDLRQARQEAVYLFGEREQMLPHEFTLRHGIETPCPVQPMR